MGPKLLVATRKGLFTLERSGAEWEVRERSFLGDPVTAVLEDPRNDVLHAALNLGHFGVKMQRSPDGGKTWEESTSPSFPTIASEQLDATPSPPSVHQVWVLETGGEKETGVLWAGTIPGGLFRSGDGGASWQLVESLWNLPEREKWFGGGYDDPGIHSICVDPRDPRHLTVGVSCGGVWVSRDGGESWDCKTDGMFAAYMPEERREEPFIQDPHRIVQCGSDPDVMWVQHHNGAFRTTDAGGHWDEIAVEPSVFGFAVAVHPKDSDTAWFVPAIKDECRIPVEGKVVVARTRDGGKSFKVLRRGLPQEDAYDLVFRHSLDVDKTGETLALGSTTGSLWVSDDAGDNWHVVSHHLPPIYQVRFSP